MVCRDHGGDGKTDIGFVVIVGHLHQVMEGNKELIRVKGNGLADMDTVIGRFLQALLCHELFLIELFARAETGILDFDVNIRLQTAETDEVTGEGIDFDGRTHIQNEDLSPVGVGTGLKNKGNGFRDRHEITDDIRVGNRDGAAFCDLFFKERDDGTVGAEHIAEADGDELRARRSLAGVRIQGTGFRGMLIKRNLCFAESLAVGVETGNGLRLAGGDFGCEGLNNHFAQAFGCPHNVGGVDGLVR